jgi:hypothetical protein
MSTPGPKIAAVGRNVCKDCRIRLRSSLLIQTSYRILLLQLLIVKRKVADNHTHLYEMFYLYL